MRLLVTFYTLMACLSSVAQTDPSRVEYAGDPGDYTEMRNPVRADIDYKALTSESPIVEGRNISYTLPNPFRASSCVVQELGTMGNCGYYVGFPFGFRINTGDIYVLTLRRPYQTHNQANFSDLNVFDSDGYVGVIHDWYDTYSVTTSGRSVLYEVGMGLGQGCLYVGTYGQISAGANGETETSFNVRVYPKIVKIDFEKPNNFEVNMTDVESAKYSLTKLNVRAYDANGEEVTITNSEGDQWDVDLESKTASFIPACYPVLRYSRTISDLLPPTRLLRRYVTPLVAEGVSLEINLDDFDKPTVLQQRAQNPNEDKIEWDLTGRRVKSSDGLHIEYSKGRAKLCVKK